MFHKINKLLLIFLLLWIFCVPVLATKFNRIIYPVVVVDDSGYSFKMKKKPEKIISTMPSITEMLFSLRLEKNIIGVTEFCDYPEAAKKITKIGGLKVNVEKVVSLEPDLIVMLGDAQKDDIERLRKLQLPVFVINPHTLDDVFSDYDKLGVLTANSHAAYSTTEWMKRRIRWKGSQSKKYTMRTTMVGTVEVVTYLKPLKALVLISKRPIIAAGKDTFIDDLLKTIGIKNIVEAKQPYPSLGKEQIFELNPDIIITTTDIAKRPQDIYNDGKFKKTSAGITKKVLILDPDIVSRPGPRLAAALEKIYDFAYNVTTSEAEDEKI